MTDWNPQPGDWVTIAGKIVELHPNQVDVGVALFSKTDQYTAFVRRDLCKHTAKPIPDEPDDGSVALVNLVAHQRFGDGHWYSAGEVGRTEGLTWGQLHMLGDVKVIHHG